MTRAWRRAVGAIAAVALAGGGLGGCTLSPVVVAVAGLDANGTPVVGAVDCAVGGTNVDRIRVSHTSELGNGLRWTISDTYSRPGPVSARSPHEPPPPSPHDLADVTLVAVGDSDPPGGWFTSRRLDAPLPEVGVLEVEATRHDASPEIELTIDLGQPEGSYAAWIDGEVVDGVSGDVLRARIAETCDEATSFRWGAFWAVAGGTVGAVLALWVTAVLVVRRQWRRAKAGPTA